MTSICITSCGVRARYLSYLDRLETSLQHYAPNVTRLLFRDVYPPGSPDHQTNHYYFKAFAMKAVYMAGFDIGIWLDAACEVLGDLTPIIGEVIERGIYVAADDQPLGEWISDQALERFSVTRDEAMQIRLCGGCIVGLDMRNGGGWQFIREWMDLGAAGLFYTSHSALAPDKMSSLRMSDGPDNVVHSTDPRCKGHRSDEACFSLMLERRGIEAVDIRKHFTNREWPNPKGLIKTGYDGYWEQGKQASSGFEGSKKCVPCGATTRGRFYSNGSFHPCCGDCTKRIEAGDKP